MDLFILDDTLRRSQVVDTYESLIWTERFKAVGDFELQVKSDRGTRALFPAGTRLAINASKRVMEVETIENKVNSNGTNILSIKGRSIEKLLMDRSNRRDSIAAGDTPGASNTTGTPGNIARAMFDTICRNNTVIPGDVIPFLQPGSMLPAGSIPEPSEVVTMTYNTGTVYDFIQNVADIYDLGFRLLRKELPNGATSQLYFDIYTGDDRTTLQTTNDAVIFSAELDNLSDTTELTSTALYKNVAYVFGLNGSKIVYLPGFDANTAGFNRRVLIVDAHDIELADGPALMAALEQRGQEELAKNGVVIAFDGEIPQFGSYIYGVHYDLGDLVETRNSDGLSTNMLVTEQIFAVDATGTRSYPTLESRLLITAGSWYAWDAGEYWDDADGYWADA
jgi:hypothetical protein